jgi:NAD(P)H-nitrite reductase large subunit
MVLGRHTGFHGKGYCAEATIKDFSMTVTESRWDLCIGGDGGVQARDKDRAAGMDADELRLLAMVV